MCTHSTQVLADLVAGRMESEFRDLPEYAKQERAESVQQRPPLSFLADLGKTTTTTTKKKRKKKRVRGTDTGAAATPAVAEEQAT